MAGDAEGLIFDMADQPHVHAAEIEGMLTEMSPMITSVLDSFGFTELSLTALGKWGSLSTHDEDYRRNELWDTVFQALYPTLDVATARIVSKRFIRQIAFKLMLDGRWEMQYRERLQRLFDIFESAKHVPQNIKSLKLGRSYQELKNYQRNWYKNLQMFFDRFIKVKAERFCIPLIEIPV
jgi:hypothetical protein